MVLVHRQQYRYEKLPLSRYWRMQQANLAWGMNFEKLVLSVPRDADIANAGEKIGVESTVEKLTYSTTARDYAN